METRIDRMGAGGDGVAPGPVFVPRALPGERVRIHILGKRGDGQAAALEEVLAPSPDRVPPPCPHFAEGCGGCAVQHWAPAAQACWKRERLA